MDDREQELNAHGIAVTAVMTVNQMTLIEDATTVQYFISGDQLNHEVANYLQGDPLEYYFGEEVPDVVQERTASVWAKVAA